MKLAWASMAATAALLATACASTTTSDEMTLAEGATEECRTVQEFGSMLPKRVCNNKATWAAIDERDKEAAKSFKESIDGRWTPVPKAPGMQ